MAIEYFGNESQHMYGVAIIIQKKTCQITYSWSLISDRRIRARFQSRRSKLTITGWPLCTDVRKCTDMYGFPKKCQKMYGLYGFFFVCTEMYGFHVKGLKIVILANCHIVAINVLACML